VFTALLVNSQQRQMKYY